MSASDVIGLGQSLPGTYQWTPNPYFMLPPIPGGTRSTPRGAVSRFCSVIWYKMLIVTQQNSTWGENGSQTSPGGLGKGLSYSRCYLQKWGKSLAHCWAGVEERGMLRLDNTIQIWFALNLQEQWEAKNTVSHSI